MICRTPKATLDPINSALISNALVQLRPKAHGALGLLLVLVLGVHATIVPSASAAEVIVACPGRLEVVDTEHLDRHGAVPLPGRAEGTLWLPDRQVLVVHLPDAGALALVDLQRFSPTRFQALRVIHSKALAAYGLGLKEIAGSVIVGFGNRVVASLRLSDWRFQAGFDRPDEYPYPFSTIDTLYLPGGIYVLAGGQVTLEEAKPDQLGRAASGRSLALAARPTAILANPTGNRLYVSEKTGSGTGWVEVFDADRHELLAQIATPDPITSLAWLDRNTLCLLGNDRLGLLDTGRKKITRWLRLQLPRAALRLIPARSI